jgi:serine/threonine protein kinase
VAIKTILHEFADEVQYVRALRDEAQLAASLNHPHLCEVSELGEALGYPYLVMEWVDGASLAELLGGGSQPPIWQPIPPVVAVQIAADVCSGLHALHEARDPTGAPLGAVHRDVSPQNLLLPTSEWQRRAASGARARVRASCGVSSAIWPRSN